MIAYWLGHEHGKRKVKAQKTLRKSQTGTGRCQHERSRLLLLCHETHQRRKEKQQTAITQVRSHHTKTHLVGGKKITTTQQIELFYFRFCHVYTFFLMYRFFPILQIVGFFIFGSSQNSLSYDATSLFIQFFIANLLDQIIF